MTQPHAETHDVAGCTAASADQINRSTQPDNMATMQSLHEEED